MNMYMKATTENNDVSSHTRISDTACQRVSCRATMHHPPSQPAAGDPCLRAGLPTYNQDAQLSAVIRRLYVRLGAGHVWGCTCVNLEAGHIPAALATRDSRGVGETRHSMAETDCRVWDLTCTLRTNLAWASIAKNTPDS